MVILAVKRNKGDVEMDLQQHKEFLWKYKLSYGETRPKKDAPDQEVYPFLNKIVETSFDDCSTQDVKDAIDACQNVEEIFDIVSDEWKDTYFLEVSNHLDQDEFSRILKKLYDRIGYTDQMYEKTYAFETERANDEVKAYLYAQGVRKKEAYHG